MPIRPSFIATRLSGVESYRFSHLPGVYTLRETYSGSPLGFTANHGFNWTATGTRRDCVAAIMADASFSL